MRTREEPGARKLAASCAGYVDQAKPSLRTAPVSKWRSFTPRVSGLWERSIIDKQALILADCYTSLPAGPAAGARVKQVQLRAAPLQARGSKQQKQASENNAGAREGSGNRWGRKAGDERLAASGKGTAAAAAAGGQGTPSADTVAAADSGDDWFLNLDGVEYEPVVRPAAAKPGPAAAKLGSSAAQTEHISSARSPSPAVASVKPPPADLLETGSMGSEVTLRPKYTAPQGRPKYTAPQGSPPPRSAPPRHRTTPRAQAGHVAGTGVLGLASSARASGPCCWPVVSNRSGTRRSARLAGLMSAAAGAAPCTPLTSSKPTWAWKRPCAARARVPPSAAATRACCIWV